MTDAMEKKPRKQPQPRKEIERRSREKRLETQVPMTVWLPRSMPEARDEIRAMEKRYLEKAGLK